LANGALTDSTFPSVILRLLAGLRRTPTGEAIYKHVATVLQNREATHRQTEIAYAELLKMLLGAFIERVSPGSALQVQLRLIQLHLTPPLSLSELGTLRTCLELYADEIAGRVKSAEPETMEQALKPLVDEYATKRTPTQPAPSGTRVVEQPAEKQPAAAATVQRVDRRSAPQVKSDQSAPAVSSPPSPRSVTMTERRVDTAYRQHLNEKRESIQRIQLQLAKHVTDTIRQNEEFGVLLDVELEALGQAGTVQELDILRKTLISEVDKLKDAHSTMTSRLEEAHKYLQIVEADSQQLSDELTRVHLLSLTDELTDLPNRRAFMRRLEDEVGRVQRYGSTLSMIIIDIDGFKAVNDQHGHAAGDEVLKMYARYVLSIFRHHDMVARYGGEEFAVLLPNTDIAGATSAVAKVQRRAAETKLTLESAGVNIALPTFSAGVALYEAGETPTDLIERADGALYRAKNSGKNRIEVARNKSSDARAH
jgi:diguanylate cyclase (GGDEF)-like protein